MRKCYAMGYFFDGVSDIFCRHHIFKSKYGRYIWVPFTGTAISMNFDSKLLFYKGNLIYPTNQELDELNLKTNNVFKNFIVYFDDEHVKNWIHKVKEPSAIHTLHKCKGYNGIDFYFADNFVFKSRIDYPFLRIEEERHRIIYKIGFPFLINKTKK